MTLPPSQPDGKSLILIVDDNEPDFFALQRVLKKIGAPNPVRHCANGAEALALLNENRDHPERQPRAILLDLNMPGMDGREMLRTIKSDAALKSIPVVVFTTSDSEHDIRNCYENGANSYITKPVDLQQLTGVVSVFYSYWFGTVTGAAS